ncbi:hypothetical protein H6F43_07090 [Leptolyngbya sp. FACHB-36]|uniref:tetratricopeptide repeat protein n=1 Tax=Leptolyngbya sp. FACHB-36 TaxID=2692808 RepID=UPI001681205B|nr:tetratricopeptide repeat protein [Leptolyngbya sp. FACHB-36]MBD2019952.1 hypothetical protein [Leptolyngbya sp. FACHB-36]
MIFQDDRLCGFSGLFFQDSEQPTFRQEWITAEMLDYSLESLRQVDDFLLRVRHEQASQDEWARMILRCGAYVGEVIRRNCRTVDYHWLGYDDAVKVNSSIAEFGKSIGTIFALYYAPETVCFPLGRIEKFLQLGSENSVFDFAEVMLSRAIAVPSPNAAESLYQHAQQQWAEAIDLSLYDDEEIILGTTPLLESALNSDPNHVPSLTLLSELLIMLKAYEEAKDLVYKLRAIEPENEIHSTKQQLLEGLDRSDFEQRFRLECWVLEKWRTIDNWS